MPWSTHVWWSDDANVILLDALGMALDSVWRIFWTTRVLFGHPLGPGRRDKRCGRAVPANPEPDRDGG